MSDDLADLGVIGLDVPLQRINGVWMRAVHLTPLATIEGNKVKAFSLSDPYGLLQVHLWTDPVADDPGAKATLPITHKDDFRALHWVLDERQQDDWTVLVCHSPAGGLTGRFKAQIAIVLSRGGEIVPVKGPQDRLDIGAPTVPLTITPTTPNVQPPVPGGNEEEVDSERPPGSDRPTYAVIRNPGETGPRYRLIDRSSSGRGYKGRGAAEGLDPAEWRRGRRSRWW